MHNNNKRDAYKLVISNLKNLSESDDVFHLIGLVATCESIISDRISAYLGGIKNEKFILRKNKDKYVSLNDMIVLSKKQLQIPIQIKTRATGLIETDDLFEELQNWKDHRNRVIHSVCKSNRNISHESSSKIFNDVRDCCITGYDVVRFILKWSDQTKRSHTKLKIKL
jgi:hypothetical protein